MFVVVALDEGKLVRITHTLVYAEAAAARALARQSFEFVEIRREA